MGFKYNKRDDNVVKKYLDSNWLKDLKIHISTNDYVFIAPS
jgi:hypothetical protein